MRSIADDLRRRTLARVLEMSISDRIALGLSLGDDDLELFMRTSRLDRAEACRRIRATRTRGRFRSATATGGQ